MRAARPCHEEYDEKVIKLTAEDDPQTVPALEGDWVLLRVMAFGPYEAATMRRGPYYRQDDHLDFDDDESDL